MKTLTRLLITMIKDKDKDDKNDDDDDDKEKAAATQFQCKVMVEPPILPETPRIPFILISRCGW